MKNDQLTREDKLKIEAVTSYLHFSGKLLTKSEIRDVIAELYIHALGEGIDWMHCEEND